MIVDPSPVNCFHPTRKIQFHGIQLFDARELRFERNPIPEEPFEKADLGAKIKISAEHWDPPLYLPMHIGRALFEPLKYRQQPALRAARRSLPTLRRIITYHARQTEAEGCALIAAIAFCPNTAAIEFHDPLTGRQAYTMARHLPAMQARECRED